MERMVGAASIAAIALTLTACGGSAPNPRDVKACQDVRSDLNASQQDALHYNMYEAIAVNPTLQKAIGAIGAAQALIGTAYSQTGYDQENQAIKITADLCAKDGVNGIS